MTKSKTFWLRAGGVVVVAVAIIAAGLMAAARSANAGAAPSMLNQIVGYAHGTPTHPMTIKRTGVANVASMSTAPSKVHYAAQPFRTRWTAAQYAAIKAAAKHQHLSMSPSVNNVQVLPDPTYRVTPNTPTTTVISGQSNTTETPSDMVIAVGDGFFVQQVNSSLQIWSINESTHAMASVKGPIAFSTFYLPANSAAATDALGDPRGFYDISTGRYFLLTDDFTNFHYYLAVSQTSDPTGSYNFYDLNVGSLQSGSLADFPGMGFDSEAVYFTGNFFASGGSGSFTNAFVVAGCKSYFETGSTSNCGSLGGVVTGFNNLSEAGGTAFTVMPAYSYGTMRAEYLVDTDQNASNTGPWNQYTFWAFSNPLELSGSQTLTGITIVNASYTEPPAATDKTGDSIDTGDNRVSAPPVVRNGDIYFAFTSSYQENPSTVLALVDWYRMDVFLNDSGLACARCATINRVLGVQNPFIGHSFNSFDPAVTADTDGNVYFTFQGVGTNLNLTTVFYSRRASTYSYSLGPDSGFFLGTGQGNYTGGRSGDFTAIALDPASCTAAGCYGVVGSGMIERTGGFVFNTGIGYAAYNINTH